jgi:hypothetical protein
VGCDKILLRPSGGVTYKDTWGYGLVTGFLSHSQFIITIYRLQQYRYFSVCSSLHAHCVFPVCCPFTSPLIPAPSVLLPGYPNCLLATATATVDSVHSLTPSSGTVSSCHWVHLNIYYLLPFYYCQVETIVCPFVARSLQCHILSTIRLSLYGLGFHRG